MNKRLFIVANRLPVTVDERGSKPASGGLVTAINSYLQRNEQSAGFTEVFWAGVPGCTTVEWEEAAVHDPTYQYLPVFVPQDRYEKYYNGFSNSVLWPLLHYFPSYAEYRADEFECYLQVNEIFAENLARHLRPNDTVWIHDYHLLPLARMLRRILPELTIGFFLHIPFPSFEIMRLLPRQWQEELLKGMLGADLIGVHTIDYASHFLQCVKMTLGIDNDMHVLRVDNRLIKVDVFPISIDYRRFHDAWDDPGVRSLRQSLQKKMGDRRIIFSIDRLDYTKGVHNRLKAYEHFLNEHPEYHNKVVFIIVVVPSRDTIPRYMERKRIIDECISQINSRIGGFHWQPVLYQYNSISFEELLAIYTASDLALITPLRDGMNLVAKEFVASRRDKRGVLVLSEMAGAARELTDALTINPNDIQEMAEKIRTGLEMQPDEQEARMERMQHRISFYDVTAWAQDFITQLDAVKKKQLEFGVKFLDDYDRRTIFEEYRAASRRLLLLDYDGTLVPFSGLPCEARPTPQLLELLQTLGSDPRNEVCLISGRSSRWLQEWFGSLPLHLVAEHGAMVRPRGGSWTMEREEAHDWKPEIQRIVEEYVKRCAGSLMEKKEFSVVWHYRNANPDQARLRAFELLTELNEFTHHLDLQVLMGSKTVEVRRYGVHKGTAVRRLTACAGYDFILAIGDDQTDEDMFRALKKCPNSYTIKVGGEASYAQYNLSTPQTALSLLDALKYYAGLTAAC